MRSLRSAAITVAVVGVLAVPVSAHAAGQVPPGAGLGVVPATCTLNSVTTTTTIHTRGATFWVGDHMYLMQVEYWDGVPFRTRGMAGLPVVGTCTSLDFPSYSAYVVQVW